MVGRPAVSSPRSVRFRCPERRPPDAPSRQAGGRRRPRSTSSPVAERPAVHPGVRMPSALSMVAVGRYPTLYPILYPGHDLEALYLANLPVNAAVERPIRSATGVHCSALALRLIVPPSGGPLDVSPGWPGDPGWLDVEPNDANRSCQHRESDPASASTRDATGQGRPGDLRALARALVAAALAVHPPPPGCARVAGGSRVAGSARWSLHPPGQHDHKDEGGCDQG